MVDVRQDVHRRDVQTSSEGRDNRYIKVRINRLIVQGQAIDDTRRRWTSCRLRY